MKAHITVDVGSAYLHSAVGTAANVHDITMTSELSRDGDDVVYGDSGYLGVEKRDESTERFKDIEFKVNRKPSSIKASPNFKSPLRPGSIAKTANSV